MESPTNVRTRDCPPDAERSLTERGIRRTTRAARGLAFLRVRPDIVFSSPLARARETAEIALRELDLAPMRLHERDDLFPMSPPESFFAALAEFHEQDVLVCGHAPHLDALLALAIGHGDPYLTQLGKAGAACVELDPTTPGRSELRWLLTARGLRSLGRG